jgi:diguanylate cyclase (GGDEF)-like protein
MSEDAARNASFPSGYETDLEDEIENRYGRDLAVIVAVTVALIAVAVGLQLYDRAEEVVPDIDDLNLNGVIAGLLLIPIAAAIFAYRRYRDSLRMAKALTEWKYRDQLTGLPNRRALIKELAQIVETSRRKGGRVAAISIDLTNVAEVNDGHGHEKGDEVLRTIGNRLQIFVKRRGFASRYSGDKFVVVLPDALHVSGLQKTADKLMALIEEPHDLPGEEMTLTSAIGAVLSEPNCIEPDDLLRDATIAMHAAASEGAGTIRVYDRSVRSRPTPSALERSLHGAVEREEFVLLYQPVVSLWTNQVAGIECLLRWNDPERGMVPPKDFLPALERTGLIVPVGQWVLQTACRKAAEWRSAYPGRPPLVVSVNVSPRQLVDSNFSKGVADAIAAVGLDPPLLCLELSNAGLTYAMSDAEEQIRTIHEMGVLVAVDDFGMGASTLVHLRDYNLNQVKIDRSFTSTIASTREDAEIVAHVVSIAKTLGLSTVAVGVETPEQIARLKSTGCDAAQGEYYAAPQAAEMIDLLLANEVGGWKPENRQPPEPPAPEPEVRQPPPVTVSSQPPLSQPMATTAEVSTPATAATAPPTPQAAPAPAAPMAAPGLSDPLGGGAAPAPPPPLTVRQPGSAEPAPPAPAPSPLEPTPIPAAGTGGPQLSTPLPSDSMPVRRPAPDAGEPIVPMGAAPLAPEPMGDALPAFDTPLGATTAPAEASIPVEDSAVEAPPETALPSLQPAPPASFVPDPPPSDASFDGDDPPPFDTPPPA